MMDLDEKVPAWLLIDWLKDEDRKPAVLAFTEGPLRQVAYAMEAALRVSQDTNAARYLALRESLPSESLRLPTTFTWTPLVVDPMNSDIGFTAEGLDRILDRMRKLRG